ncbi:GNAT family N-acetyltransferase [Actinopolymorpha singaporensis]|uniref:Acetyltransferase (GNAT) family protein n=1 Tax=Actinopolymorpha singaporensis TaxID=117157 RepID=A0A1H1WJA5_9ACTN|nr:GNAT family N-acetyltransferase [Actinopolymorpha singaporensis]SDS97185.1 Acetyltransferase (GNAT) family protein [Actinopolymorpha singaporensis]
MSYPDVREDAAIHPDVQVLQPEDVAAVARLHVRSFTRFFLTCLGERFLREFYRAFVEDPAAVTVVARDATGRVVGAVVGSVAPDQFFRRMLRRQLIPLLVASLLAALRRPTTVARLLRGLCYRGGVPFRVRGALLSSICVDPVLEASGIGRRLLEAWWSAVRARGVTDAYLSTDAERNGRVNRFYQRAGWELLGSYRVAGGRRMNCYRISAPPG